MSPLIGLGGRHLCLHLGRVDVRGHKWPFELPVNLVVCGIAVGIRSHPAVVLDGGVQRLRSVADVMPQPAGIKENRLFHRLGFLVVGRHEAVLAHGGLQPLPHLGRLPGLQANLLRPLAGGKDLGLEVQPLVRQRAQRIGRLQVDEVFRGLRRDNSGSAGERQRSGSGPRYSISLMASSECRKAGISAGRSVAARRLIIRCPSLPQAWATSRMNSHANSNQEGQR